MSAAQIRDRFLVRISRLETIAQKVLHYSNMQGVALELSFPDVHDIFEGLFLSAWSQWERFVRDLFIEFLATSPVGEVHRRVRQFRTARAPRHLAEWVVEHPDERSWVDWADWDIIKQRASVLLGPQSPFMIGGVSGGYLTYMKKVRNAIAHRSDVAWLSFLKMVAQAPFNLTSSQKKGLTVGRFLRAHHWGVPFVLQRCLSEFRGFALRLVP